MPIRRSIAVAAAGTALISALAGCSQRTISSANSDANHDISVANQTVDQAARDLKPKLKAFDLGARVTTALQANQNLPHDSIRVDGSPTGVRLKGTVKTAAQKQLAGQVAKDTIGPNKTVQNDLAIRGA